MRKIFLFMMISLDGYFEGPGHDLSCHQVDAEFNEFAIAQLKTTGTLLFGHRTYDMMAAFWPNEGMKLDPMTAIPMAEIPKIVATHSPFTPQWENTTVIGGDIFDEVKKLKEKPGKDIAIFGSNNLCVSLMSEGLVDEFRIMVNPLALGQGTSLFTGLTTKTDLKLIKSRTFKNGNVLHYYSK